MPRKRDHIGAPCPYCGRIMEASGRLRPTYDHMLAKSKARGGNRGGVIVCSDCNQKKGNMSPSQWLKILHLSSDEVDAARAKLMPKAVVKYSSIGWF